MSLTAEEVLDSHEAVDYIVAKDKNDKISYLGDTLFPNVMRETSEVEVLTRGKVSVTALKASALDTMPTLRMRDKFSMEKVVAPFFREYMQVTERDEEKLMNIENTKSPAVKDIVRDIYNDTATLKKAADINPEIMRFQLLFPSSGGPSISIGGVDDTVYKFDYDPNGTWATNNRTDLSGVKLWSNPSTADPVRDIKELKDSDDTDADLKYLIMNKNTLQMIAKCDTIRDLVIQKSVDSTVKYVTDSMVIDILKTYCELDGVVIYNKKVKNEAGTKVQLVPDGYVGLCETLNLGTTWRVPTPEERTKGRKKEADISIVPKTRVCVTIYTTSDIPTVTKVYVSESCLPTFRDMNNYYLMYVGTPTTSGGHVSTLTCVAAEGTASGTSKFTITGMVDSTNNTLRIKQYASGTPTEVPNYMEYSAGTAWKNSAEYTSGDDYTVADGLQVEIREIDAESNCVAYVVATADTKA